MLGAMLRPVPLAAGLACLALFPPAGAQNYVLVEVANNRTPRPDGKSTMDISALVRPALDGTHVVFRDFGVPAPGVTRQTAIWSQNLLTGAFVKLADLDTPAPGGTGNFRDLQALDSAPLARAGVVLFVGRDAGAPGLSGGLYTVPVTGGRITRVADYNTANPSGGVFTVVDSFSRTHGIFSIDGGRVAFQGRNAAGVTGIYTANVDGSGLARLAHSLSPFRVGNYDVTCSVDPSPPRVAWSSTATASSIPAPATTPSSSGRRAGPPSAR